MASQSSNRFYSLADDLDVLHDRITSTSNSDGYERIFAEADTMLSLMHREIANADPSSRPRMESTFNRKSQQWSRTKRTLKAVDSSTQSLTRATRMAEENTQIGTEVLSELGVQRDKLTRTRDLVNETDVELGRAHRILRSMDRRLLTNKFLLIVIILLEVGTLSLIVYLKWFRGKK